MPEIRYPDGSVRQGRMVGAAHIPDLNLDGLEITFVRVDNQSRLQLGDTEIVIETPFRLTAGHETHDLDPNERGSLGPLLALYPNVVTNATVADDLTLRLAFEGGQAIEVPQDSHYESWSVVGPAKRLIVCPPAGSGELAIWL